MLTIRMVSVNTAGQMEKRSTGQFPWIELVVSSVEGPSAHGTKERPNDTSEHLSAARLSPHCPGSACLPSAGVAAILNGDSQIVIHEGETEEIRFFGIDRPKKIGDFGKRAKGFAFGMVFGRLQVWRSNPLP
jgi:endonuclease YncB( thermonuclease family)